MSFQLPYLCRVNDNELINITIMTDVIIRGNTKLSKKLLAAGKANADKFLTGQPIAVAAYGRDKDNKLTYVTYKTTDGIEDTFKGSFDCLASAISDSVIVVRLTDGTKV